MTVHKKLYIKKSKVHVIVF